MTARLEGLAEELRSSREAEATVREQLAACVEKAERAEAAATALEANLAVRGNGQAMLLAVQSPFLLLGVCMGLVAECASLGAVAVCPNELRYLLILSAGRERGCRQRMHNA
jgi:hypothetical protein